MNYEQQQQLGDHAKPIPEGRKIGEGALAAAWRQGLAEVGQALKAFPDSVQVIEAGQLGTATPATVYAQQGMHKEEERQEAVAGMHEMDMELRSEAFVYSLPLTQPQQQDANARAADAAKADRSYSLPDNGPQQGRTPERSR